MGSIIIAFTKSKRILIKPSLVKFGEQQNDHQLATAFRFREKKGLWVSDDKDTFLQMLNKRLSDNECVRRAKQMTLPILFY